MTRLLFLLLSVLLTFNISAQQKKKKKPFKLPENINRIKDVEYRKAETKQGEKSMLLDLYLPKESKEKVPVVMWIHGGGWKNGSKGNGKGLWLVKEGFAVVSINLSLIHI